MNKRFIFGIVAFVVLVFIMQLRMPKEFSWEMTFRHDSREPFGCLVFDSLMSASSKNGYTMSHQTFYQLAHDSTWAGKPRGILVVSKRWDPDSMSISQMLNLVSKGSTVMLSSYNITHSSLLCDTLGLSNITSSYSEFSAVNLRHMMENGTRNLYDSIVYVGHPETYSHRSYLLYESLIDSHFYSYEDTVVMHCDTLAYTVDNHSRWLSRDELEENTYYEPVDSSGIDEGGNVDEDGYIEVRDTRHHPIAVSFNFGKGRLVLVTTPLLFTNYAVLNDTISELTFRLMSEFGDLPVVRTDKYGETTIDEMRKESPFRYFVSQPPLRVALYSALVMLLLYMVFNSRRRQRVIPVIKPPANRSLEFMKLVGTLYYERHDNADLMHTKYRGFVEEVRRKTGLDVDDDSDDEQLFELLAEKTGESVVELRDLILRLRQIDSQEGGLSDEMMKQQINRMNEILKLI